jgi:tRNA-2-methylthio-N6-dimethylallyladenosine synthase
VVPYTRGSLVCRSFKDIIKEAKLAVKNGAKEIWLLGQNVNDYKSEGKDFSDLIIEVDKIPGDFWIRFTSPHPAQVSNKFIDTLAKCEKFTPYLNLPAQAGDNKVLKAMNRPYTVAHYLGLIKKLRSAFKKYRKGEEKILAISTDLIVGFPNETDTQFENTKKLVSKAGFMLGYISQYSARKGTPAAKNDNIKNFVKKARWRELNQHLAQEVLKFNSQFIGTKQDCLVFEKQEKDGSHKYFAKTKHYITVAFQSKDANLVGQLVKINILKANSWILEGELINKKAV